MTLLMKICKTCNDNIQIDGIGKPCLVVESTEWDSYSDGFRQIWLRINYCPECGKDLRKNE